MAYSLLSEKDQKLEVGETKKVDGRTWTLKDTAGDGKYGKWHKQGAISRGVEKFGESVDKILDDPDKATKLLMALNTVVETSKMVPLSSGQVKTPLGQIATGVTRGLVQGKQLEIAETAAQAKKLKAQKGPERFIRSIAEEGDLNWYKTEYLPSIMNSAKRKTQVDLRYNLIFGVKDDLPTGAIESIIAPLRKLAIGLWQEDSDKMNFFDDTVQKYMTNDTANLSNEQIVQFQDQFKALTMEQVIQDAKNLYPVSEADVKRLLDAAGDIGTYSGALKNLVSIQKAVSMSNSYYNDGIDEYFNLNEGNARGLVSFVGANGEIITSTNLRDFAKKYADYKMGADVKDALKNEDIAKVYKKHDMITGEETNLSKLTNFDKLFATYAINLMDKDIVNLQEIDAQSQNAWLAEQAEKYQQSIEDLQEKLQE
jgi:hypothetical protein